MRCWRREDTLCATRDCDLALANFFRNALCCTDKAR